MRPRPVAFRQFILKVASRCNLACDYCYVYRAADQSWRSRPRFMSPATVAAVSRRIGEHMRAHDLPEVQVGLHGGEPLLAGQRALENLITALRSEVPRGARMSMAVLTNGVLLDEMLLRLFGRHQVRVAISLDGTQAANDRHRRRADGGTSYPDVTRALRLLGSPVYDTLFAGLLCTIDVANDPVATYQTLREFTPPVIDFLLPHGNWSHPPPHLAPASGTPYADWLLPIFDHWYADPAADTSIRLFDEVIHLLLGGDASVESIGGGGNSFTVVETDGSIEGPDSLKSAYHGAASTGLSVFGDSFDQALHHPAIAAQQLGPAALCETCQSCPVLRVCGGGHYAHRYRDGSGFRNPSVYSADLRRLIGHIGDRVHSDLERLRSSQP
jgi:uncharacterized protein